MEEELYPRDDSDEAQLIPFSNEYMQSTKVKKVSLIIDSLKSKNESIRLFSSKKLTEIGDILGAKRIEDELIPFITDLILNYEENEEILCEFSNQLLNLLLILRKQNIFSSIGLRSLEILSGNDDENVRQTSVQNLSKLIDSLDEELITTEIFPLMKRLIENDLKTKMSCCYLFPIVYPKLKNEEIKKEIVLAFYEISHDESPSVRRASADNIKNFCKVNEPKIIEQLVNLYNDFIKDPVDIVKIYTINSTKELLEHLPNEQKEILIINLTQIMSSEKSWRVKYATAECISKICSIFSKTFNEMKFVPLLMLFLKDNEPEVKCSVLTNFHIFFENFSLDIFKTNFLPIFNDLSNDINLHVRSIFASTLLKCIKFFKSDENFLTESIIPLLTKLLKDEVYEVQYSAVENIDQLILLNTLNNDIMENFILPIIQEGMKNPKWRFRLFIAENLLKVVSQIPKEKIKKDFLGIIILLFVDHAEEIRKTSWKIIEEIIKNVDNTFLNEEIWPIQKDKLSSKNYILRIASMNSINYLKEYYEKDFLKNTILPEIKLTGKNDKIPNVKFCSCNLYKNISQYLNNKDIINDCMKYLQEFENDIDPDVVFFSKKAYEELQQI